MRRALTAAISSIVFVASFGVASAGRLNRSCGSNHCSLDFKGTIEPGNSKALELAILTAPDRVQFMTITSPGGDPFEALNMSTLLNKYFIELFAGQRNANGVLVELGSGACASACALMYLTADQRFGTEVFLHRPTFVAASFRAIPDDMAGKAYNTKARLLQEQLSDRAVSSSLIDKIMSIPSDTVAKLEPGFPERSVWIQEWLAAKCGGDATTQRTATQALAAAGDLNAYWGPLGAQTKCESAAIAEAQLHTQRPKRPVR